MAKVTFFLTGTNWFDQLARWIFLLVVPLERQSKVPCNNSAFFQILLSSAVRGHFWIIFMDSGTLKQLKRYVLPIFNQSLQRRFQF